MLRLTRETEYGLLAMIHIAKRPSGILSYRKEISRKFRIPANFLAKVLQKLVRRDLIHSRLGVAGGYSLARTPSEISFGEIIEAIEGPQKIVDCVDGSRDCIQLAVCSLEPVMCELQEKVGMIFRGITLDELCRRAGGKKDSVSPRHRGGVP